MAYCRARGRLPSKVDCIALCKTFNSMSFKKASKNCFYEDYVLLRNQLLLLEYDEDDPSVPSKLYEITDMLRRFIEDIPKPVQHTVEFVRHVQRTIFFLYGVASRDIRDYRRFPNSQELHSLLVRYVELECEVLYNSPQNYLLEYQKQAEERIMTLLHTILQDSKSWRTRDKLEGNSEELWAMNTLHIMKHVKVEYKKDRYFIENIMRKLLKRLNVMDKVSEMKSKNKTFPVDKIMQVPQVQKLHEYLQNRDYGLEDSNTSEDEIEEIVEVEIDSPLKNELFEPEQKFDVSSFACYNVQRKVMTFDLIDEDFSMVYFQPEVQSRMERDRKSVFDGFNVQIPERTRSNISDRFDKYIQLNSVTTSTTCDNKVLNSRSAIPEDSVVIIDDDSDSDVEFTNDRSSSIVNLENDAVVTSELTNIKQQSPPHADKPQHVQDSQPLKSATNSSDLEDALLQCDDISDNEIENEDEILNKFNDEIETNVSISAVTNEKSEVVICNKKLDINSEKNHTNESDQDNNQKDKVTCPLSDQLNPSEKELQNIDDVINRAREVDNDSTMCNVNPVESRRCEISTTSCKSPPPTVHHVAESEENEDCNKILDVPIDTNDVNEINTFNENSSNLTTAKNNHKSDNVDANDVAEHFTADIQPVNHSIEIVEPIVHTQTTVSNDDSAKRHIKEKHLVSTDEEAKNLDVCESSTQSDSVTTINPSCVVTVEESCASITHKIESKDVDKHELPTLLTECNTSTDVGVNDDVTLLRPHSEDYVKDKTIATEVGEEEIIAEVHEDDQVSDSQKCRSNEEDSVIADKKLLGDINCNIQESIQSEMTAIVQNNDVHIEDVDIPCIANEEEIEASNDEKSVLHKAKDDSSDLPVDASKSNQDKQLEILCNIQEQESATNVEDNVSGNNEALPSSDTNDHLNLTIEAVVTESECIISPTTSYENQTSSEDIEEYTEQFTGAFPDHNCSNNLDVLATVAAEQEKMENSVQVKQRANRKKSKKVTKLNKVLEKPKKKTKKSESTEGKNIKEIGMVTRRITRSSAQLNYTNLPQDHLQCMPSTFLNSETLVTPTPNRVYNLIPESATDNEESLDEPFNCCLVNCENQQNPIDAQLPEILTKNPVFDEDTIEDGISLVCHKKQQNNNDEVVISIPDSEKDYPGINYDILEQAEQFAETNVISSNYNLDENAVNFEISRINEIVHAKSSLENSLLNSKQTATQSEVSPVDDRISPIDDSVGKSNICQEVNSELTTKISECNLFIITTENDSVVEETVSDQGEDQGETNIVKDLTVNSKQMLSTVKDQGETNIVKDLTVNLKQVLPTVKDQGETNIVKDLTVNLKQVLPTLKDQGEANIVKYLTVNSKQVLSTVKDQGETNIVKDLTVNLKQVLPTVKDQGETNIVKDLAVNSKQVLSTVKDQGETNIVEDLTVNLKQVLPTVKDQGETNIVKDLAVNSKQVLSTVKDQGETNIVKDLTINLTQVLPTLKDQGEANIVKDLTVNSKQVLSTVKDQGETNIVKDLTVNSKQVLPTVKDQGETNIVKDLTVTSKQVLSTVKDQGETNIVEDLTVNSKQVLPTVKDQGETNIVKDLTVTSKQVLSTVKDQGETNIVKDLAVNSKQVLPTVKDQGETNMVKDLTVNSKQVLPTVKDQGATNIVKALMVNSQPVLATVKDQGDKNIVKDVRVSSPQVLSTVSENDASVSIKATLSNDVDNAELATASNIENIKISAGIISAIPDDVSHEIINRTEEKVINATNNVEAFNEAEPTVNEVKISNTPIVKTENSSFINVSPKKDKRKAPLSKTLLMPVKKRKNYGKKNIIINKYEEKNIETNKTLGTYNEAEVTVRDQNIDAVNLKQQEEPIINNKLDESKYNHIRQTDDVPVLKESSSKEAKDDNQECLSEVSPVVTNKNHKDLTSETEPITSDVVNDVLTETLVEEVETTTIQIQSDADTNIQEQSNIIEENDDAKTTENTISEKSQLKNLAENKLQSEENNQDVQSLNILEIQQEVVDEPNLKQQESAEVEPTQEEFTSTKSTILEEPQLTIEETVSESVPSTKNVNEIDENKQISNNIEPHMLQHPVESELVINKDEQTIKSFSEPEVQSSNEEEIQSDENKEVAEITEVPNHQILTPEEPLTETVVATENATAVSFENETVVSTENATVVSIENKTVVSTENETVVSLENETVVPTENETVVSTEKATVVSIENETVVSTEKATVVSIENETVVPTENATVVSIENETPQDDVECTTEVLVESEKTCDEDNNVSQTPPVLEKIVESPESGDELLVDGRKENARLHDYEEDNRDTRTMPTLEREVEQVSKPDGDAEVCIDKEQFLDDSYPLLAAYEIEAVTEEVVESCNSDIESQKSLPVSEENIELKTSPETLVEIPKQAEVPAAKEVLEVCNDSTLGEQMKKIATKVRDETDNKIVKLVTNNNMSEMAGNRRVRTKAALKEFQNPYVQLQKLPDNYVYKRKLSESIENPKAAKISEQRSKSQDATSKRQKHDGRSLYESKHKKKHENLEKSESLDLPKNQSSRREKSGKHKDQEVNSKKRNVDYVSDKNENKNKANKNEMYKSKTRSSSQKQRDKETKLAEKYKTSRSLSESKIEIKSKQNEIISEKKSAQSKDKNKSKDLKLFSVEDSKITYFDKKQERKQKQDKEVAQCDSFSQNEKRSTDNHAAIHIKSTKKEEKLSRSIVDKTEDIENHKSSVKDKLVNSNSRSSSRSDRKSSKHARDKTEKEEIETASKHSITPTDDANKNKAESNSYTRRNSRRSMSVSRSTDSNNKKDEKANKETEDTKEKLKKNENHNSEKITNSDSNSLKSKSDKIKDNSSQKITSNKSVETSTDNKRKSSDHKRHRSSRSSSKNSEVVKSENKDAEDVVHEKKKPKIEKDKENICVVKSETENDSTKKQTHKKLLNADFIENNSNNLQSNIVVVQTTDLENEERRFSKRERRGSLRISSSREKAKIKENLKQNAPLSETECANQAISEATELPEKPKEKFLEESKRLPKKRRLSEIRTYELEEKNSKKPASKKLILEDKQSKTTNYKPVDCKVILETIETEKKEIVTDPKNEKIMTDGQRVEHSSKNENLDDKKNENLEISNSIARDHDGKDHETAITPENTEALVDDELIETSEEKNEKFLKNPPELEKNGKNTINVELPSVNDDLINTSSEETEKRMENQEFKNESSLGVNCEKVIDANGSEALVEDAIDLTSKEVEPSMEQPELKVQNIEPVVEMVIENDASGEKNEKLIEKPDSKEIDSKEINNETIIDLNNSAATRTEDLNDSSCNKHEEELVKSPECKEKDHCEIVTDTKIKKSLRNADFVDTSAKKEEKLEKPESKKKSKNVNSNALMDTKNAIDCDMTIPSEKLKEKTEPKEKESKQNNYKKIIHAKNTETATNDDVTNSSSKKREKSKKQQSKKKDPKRIDFIIENLKNRNSKKNKTIDCEQAENPTLDEISKTDVHSEVTSSKTTVKCDENMETCTSPQELSEKPHSLANNEFSDPNSQETTDTANKNECMDHSAIIPDTSESITSTKSLTDLNDFEQVTVECNNSAYEHEEVVNNSSVNKADEILPQTIDEAALEKESFECSIIPSSVSEINDAVEETSLVENADLEHRANDNLITNIEQPEIVLNNSVTPKDNAMHEILEEEFNKNDAEKSVSNNSSTKLGQSEVFPSIKQSSVDKFEGDCFIKNTNSLPELTFESENNSLHEKNLGESSLHGRFENDTLDVHSLEKTSKSELHMIVDSNLTDNIEDVDDETSENSHLDIRPHPRETLELVHKDSLTKAPNSESDIADETNENCHLDIRPCSQETNELVNTGCLTKTPNSESDIADETNENCPLGIRHRPQGTIELVNRDCLTKPPHSESDTADETNENCSVDIRPRPQETTELVNRDCVAKVSNSETDAAFIEKYKVSSLSSDILKSFKDHAESTSNNKHRNKNENYINIVPVSTTEIISSKNSSVPGHSGHSLNDFAVPVSASQALVAINQVSTSLPLTENSVPLMNVDKRQPEEVIVNLSTSTAETSTSCETTDNLIAVIFSNVALCNNTEVINDSEQNQPNKTGFIYFRGTDHNYHSVGDPLLSGKCDNNESDHSSDNSKEVPTPELENVLVDDNILPYIPTLTENNLNQELSSSLSESPVDSSSDFQLLEQLIGNTLARESSPPLPQTCDALYQANLKQEVLDYDDSSASSNMEFSKESSEVYINQFQQQTMSVENMSELMNAVLTRIQNLNNMTRPTQRYDSTSKENFFQPIAAEFNVSPDNVQTTNTNSVNVTSHNLESDCNFVAMQEISNTYTHPESSNVEYSNISFGNEVPETVSFETDFTNFYYLPVHDSSLNNNCNKKVIVERIPQYPEQQIKPFTEINNPPNVTAVSASLATSRTTANVNVKPAHSSKQPVITRSLSKIQPTTTNISEIPTTIKPTNLSPEKIKQADVNSDVVTTSTAINVGFVRTSSRTRVSAPRPKKPSDRKNADARESEESGPETDRTFNSANKTDCVLKLKVRGDLGISNNSVIDTTQQDFVPAKERSLCIIEDSNGLSASKQNSRVSIEETSGTSSNKLEARKSSNKKEKDTYSVEDLSRLNAKVQSGKVSKEDVVCVEDLNKLNARKHNTNSKPQKPTEAPSTDKKNQTELTIENPSVKDAKSQTTELITSAEVAVQNNTVESRPESSQSDMFDSVKRRKRKPVDYYERIDYSSIVNLLRNEHENARTPQRTRQRKEEAEDVSPRSKKRKQDSDDKQLKPKNTNKPSHETEKNKTDAVSVCSVSDTESDTVAKPKASIFEDSDDDIPKKKKSKPEPRLEPDMMNDLFDRLVKEGNVNTIKNSNMTKPSKNPVPSSSISESFKEAQKLNKNLLDVPHTSNTCTIANNIFSLEAGLNKKPDAITPVKQIGVVTPIPRARKEPPCNRNSYGGGEESRNSSQYYPYYSERNRRSYPYSNRESSRSSHQGSSRRMDYQPHSNDQRYSSSQRSSSSGRSSRSSRHHSNSRSSTEQRNYNRYASAAATDLAWREDMKKKFPNMFKDEVYF